MTDIEKVEYRRDLEYISEHYGLNNQLEHTKLELKELIEAIEDYEKSPSVEHYNHVSEEIADVENMTFQDKMLMKSENSVDKFKRFKVDRQLKRIEKGE